MSVTLKFCFQKMKTITFYKRKIIETTQKRHNFACDNYTFPKTLANKSKRWTQYSFPEGYGLFSLRLLGSAMLGATFNLVTRVGLPQCLKL